MIAWLIVAALASEPTTPDPLYVDADGDGRLDEVLCDASGLGIHTAAGRVSMWSQPCRAVAVLQADRKLLIAAGTRLTRFGLGAGGPVALGSFGEDLPVFGQIVEWHFVEELEHPVTEPVTEQFLGG